MYGLAFQALVIFGLLLFFFRMSNLVLLSVASFFTPEAVGSGDITFKPGKIVVLNKWSKTLQSKNDVKLITVPKIPFSSMCPVSAISNLVLLTSRGLNLSRWFTKLSSTYPCLILGLE